MKPKPEHLTKSIIRRSLGICLGASTVSLVELEQEFDETHHLPIGDKPPRIIQSTLFPHGGNPKEILRNAIMGMNPERFDKIAVTGRKFRHIVNLSSISEPEAVEYAYHFVKPPDQTCPAIVSAGGETFMVYVLNQSGQISNVITGNKCASGTGEFFMQQLRRMNVSLDEAALWSATEEPYCVSGRCSVFCKSDCTHATNKGIPKSKVTAGLCKMMADKILELLKKTDRHNIMLVGGTANNRLMVDYLDQRISGLIVPEQAAYFEALGAALWALKADTRPFPGEDHLISTGIAPFERLAPLAEFADRVEFKTIETSTVRTGDGCILGLDVGSTTTKAVLLRRTDDALLASVYLRTNGDPVAAARSCYAAILDHIKLSVDPADILIKGIGVCGSGRQIAALHALTDGMINEIIAHATAAVYFDPGVDTIFEIGGQDAKYTYITNGVPSDYAMNEACSAGTGSFLEEAALETLGLDMEEIAPVALDGHHPPNFNDQCAAFIASDIKNAIHEGIRHEDIVAGLVYSICMNYSNRVKGNRPVGEKVFMQGGVCYNQAVPLAMAALVGKPIIVPPEPGLMGAFGVALAVKQRIESGLMDEKEFDLQALVDRNVAYGKPFTCRGGKAGCDRRCRIERIQLEGNQYPFGGACNRYYNLRNKKRYDVKRLDLVNARQKLMFETYGASDPGAHQPWRGRIGFNRSFLVNSYYPLYSTFFAEIGFEPFLSDRPTQEGIDSRNAAFCFPAELSHGFFHALLSADDPPAYIFLPHFKSVPANDNPVNSQVCPFVQGEPFYLQTTFQEKLAELEKRGTKVLSPLIHLNAGLAKAGKPLVDTAVQIGIRRKDALKAFQKALQQQKTCMAAMKTIGRQTLMDLEVDSEQIGVVIFGRPYNAYVDEAHMGIPHKLASRGVTVIPLDFLDVANEHSKRHMYWGMGQLILSAARIVKSNPSLFGTYITNFSCGPDSFLIGYFRDIMQDKPSLTLELDSHTADAGLETRIEAFLDIVRAYRQLKMGTQHRRRSKFFVPAKTVFENGSAIIATSAGEKLPLTDPRVTLLFPSMGQISAECLVAAFQSKGINAKAYPPAGEAELKTGRAHTSCKECLPLILTTGTLLNYYHNQKRDDEVLAYFMATGSGPCRFGQYAIFMEDLIAKHQMQDTAIFTLTSDNAYAGLGLEFEKKGWWAIVIADVLEDIRSMLLANAVDQQHALSLFESEKKAIITTLRNSDYKSLERQLINSAKQLKSIELQRPPESVPIIFLAGEIFVRRDELSRQYITERLAENGFATICSPVSEWMLYTDYLVDNQLEEFRPKMMEKLKLKLKMAFKSKYERRIKTLLSRSGLVHAMPINIETIIRNGSDYISPQLGGEAILTVGSSITEIVTMACGVIAIGPFGCMPNRLSESILIEIMNRNTKLSTSPSSDHLRAVLTDIDDLPFLAIESDGSPFPQLIEAKLEAFYLRARRLHDKLYTYN